MKKKIVLLSFLAVLAFSFVIFNACKKKITLDTPNTQQPALQSDAQTTADENTRAEQNFSDMFDASEAAISQKGMSKVGQASDILSGCANVSLDAGTTLDSTQWPKQITIDFGANNCKGDDLRERRGKIHVKLSNWYRKSGAVVTITPDNYYVNDYLVEGTKTVTNMGFTGDQLGNYYQYDISVSGKITSPAGKVSTWASTRVRKTYINTLKSVLFYMISGNASGVHSNGKPYTLTINQSLEVVPLCHWITQGSISIIPGNNVTNTITIDYGNGDCDDKATVTFLGQTSDYELT